MIISLDEAAKIRMIFRCGRSHGLQGIPTTTRHIWWVVVGLDNSFFFSSGLARALHAFLSGNTDSHLPTEADEPDVECVYSRETDSLQSLIAFVEANT